MEYTSERQDWTSHQRHFYQHYGESRKKQAPLQIKIGDRFDNPAIHSRIGTDAARDQVAVSRVPTIDQRTALAAHFVKYPWE